MCLGHEGVAREREVVKKHYETCTEFVGSRDPVKFLKQIKNRIVSVVV